MFEKPLSQIILLVLALGLPAGGRGARAEDGAAPAKRPPNGVYIVRMADEPVVAYTGGLPGLRATAPVRGQKIDPDATAVVDYVRYLDGRHDEALSRVGGGRKLYDYRFSFNGFAAALSPAQAGALRGVPGVRAVDGDAWVEADTSSTPRFLGLTDSDGLWAMLGGAGRAGEDVVIGLVDSGIWPEHPSFGDRTGLNGNATQDGKLDYQQIPGWHGKCVPGEAFDAANCNQKLIGAQYFDAAWGGDAAIRALRPWEFVSPRDYNGHGSHTASTAGGNGGVLPAGPMALFGPISGMAPRARIAAYKALWSTEDASTASGYTSDLVAAVDQAVRDGVDVINYSISGTLTNFLDAAQVAFLYAARAGVFVSCSAGNAGPTTSTVAHPGPWLTTVAAGTHDRSGEGSVTMGNGATYSGASVATAVGPAPLIDSTAAGLAGADPTLVALCYAAADNGGTPVLDPAKVAGKIVVCDRGVTARVNKSLAVREAGGVGMLLVNVTPGSLNADFHYLPTVHLADTDRAAVKAYAATAGATATIHQASMVYTTPAPFTASFSSRGPLRAGNGNLLKPDLIAPGQDILAAVAPPGNGGYWFNLYSGTSMSSPHVAGLAALLRDLHPDGSPMMIKSALMTSASNVLDGPDTNPLVIFRQGAGHVRPNRAADPGLVLDAGWNDWLAFLCGATTGVSPSTCSALGAMGYSLDPSNLNVPSIAVGALAGVQAVTRRVTNVGAAPATYSASVTGLPGFQVTVAPPSLTLARGATGTVTATFTRTTAAFNAYAGGQLTWTDGAHAVRLPVVLRPVALVAPASVAGTGGALSYPVTFGYSGTFAATARGLIPPATFAGTVAGDPTGTFVPGGPGTVAFDVLVPAGTSYARFALFDANVSPASDLDLYVYRDTTLVGSSTGATAAEEVSLVNPTAATYTVWVHGYSVPPPSASFTLFAWVLGTADAGNMTVSAPTAAILGGSGNITLGFSGLAPATRYLGAVAYSGTSGLPGPTVVRVDTP